MENGGAGQARIKGATLIGDGPSVLTRVVGIGHDMELDEGIGMCARAGRAARPASASQACWSKG